MHRYQRRGARASRQAAGGCGTVLAVPSWSRDEITVVLADDDHHVAAALGGLLDQEPDFRVVGQASDGDEALAAAREHRAALVVTVPGAPAVIRRLLDT